MPTIVPPTAKYWTSTAIGYFSVNTVLAKPIRRSVETARMTAVIDQAGLCRVVRGAPRNANAISTKANG